jgi:hypothetical protein
MIKSSIHQGEITTLNFYIPKNKIVTELKGEIHKYTTRVRNVNFLPK